MFVYKNIVASSVRLSSLAGRMLFVVFMAAAMSPQDAGIYAAVAAYTFLSLQIVGLEAYQTKLRDFAKSSQLCSTSMKRLVGSDETLYGGFVVISASGLLLLSVIFFETVFEWGHTVCILAAFVAASEYIGAEVCRILNYAGEVSVSLYSASLRAAPWSLGLPLWYYMFDAEISIELVLGAWLICSISGILYVIYVTTYIRKVSFGGFIDYYWSILVSSGGWLVIALSTRMLDAGARFFPAILNGEVEAARFALVSTLASVGYVATKSIIEPRYVRVLSVCIDIFALRSFNRAVLLVSFLSGIAGFCVLYFMVPFSKLAIDALMYWTYLAAWASFTMLSLACVPFYKIYASRQDRINTRIGSEVLLFSVLCVGFCTWRFGILGCGVACMISSALLYLRRFMYASKL